MFICNWLSSYIRYFITTDFSPDFIYFIFTSSTTRSTHLFRRSTVRSTSLHSRTEQDDHLPGADGLHRQPTGRLLGANSRSAFSSPPTSWLDYSSHGLHRQLRRGLASQVRDFLVFGFFVQASPAKLGTPLVVESCYASSVCYQDSMLFGSGCWS
jgi:hypothetical protein